MPNLFTKPVDLVTAEDIRALIGQPEGQRLEFKGRLDFDPKNKSADSWLTEPTPGRTRSGPDEYAREALFRELCGFANTDGGWLILGIEETQARPRTASGLRVLPDCYNLAEQLERAAQTWFDPPLTAVRCQGVEMDGEPGQGVVVMHVPRSATGPHRLDKAGRTREAYRRAGEQTLPMRMREIQDMVLERSRGSTRIDEAFAASRKSYANVIFQRNRKFSIGYSISLIPINGPLTVDRPYRHNNLFERYKSLSVLQNGAIFCNISCFNSSRGVHDVIPVLRGGRARWFDYSRGLVQEENESITYIDVKDNGNIQIILKQNVSHGILLDWLLVDTATALLIANKVREFAGDSMASFAMLIEIIYESTISTKDAIPVGLLGEEEAKKKIPYNPMIFPIYIVDEPTDISQYLSNILNDFNNLLSKPHQDGITFNLL